jgi:hypothetical protein
MATIRIGASGLESPATPSPLQVRAVLHDALQHALHTQRRDLEGFRATDSTGALRRFEDPDLAHVEIMWRCWLAGQRFSGLESDVVRTSRGVYALVAPENGPDRRDEARLALLLWADPVRAAAAAESPAPEDSSGASTELEPTHLPWPWHVKASPRERIRDALDADDIELLDRLADAAERDGSVPGFATLLAGADLALVTRSPGNAAAATDESGHFRRLVALFRRMAAGETVTPRDEIALTFEDMPPRLRVVAERRIGVATGQSLTLREIGEVMGISAERTRQLMETVYARCTARQPLLPVCMAAWRAFPRERVAATLAEWWAALPSEIRPAIADDLLVLRAAEEWYWFPRAGWTRSGEQWIVSVDGPPATRLDAAVTTAERALRHFAQWGAVSIQQLAEAADVHLDVARCVASVSDEWTQVTPDWFACTRERTVLGVLGARLETVPARSRAKRLRGLVRRRQDAGKPASIVPAAVLAAIRGLRQPIARPQPARSASRRVVGHPEPAMPNRVSMPMNESKSTDALSLTGAQAKFVLESLVREGRIGPDDVGRHLLRMREEIQALEQRLAQLRGLADGVGDPDALGRAEVLERTRADGPTSAPVPRMPTEIAVPLDRARDGIVDSTGLAGFAEAVQPGEAPNSQSGKRRRRRPINLKPETLASRRLQGHYLNLMRKVPADSRELYKEMARELGREVAINAMEEAIAAAR